MTQGGAPVRRWGHGACLVGGDHGGGSAMLVCGGVDATGAALSDCWVLDLEEMRWENVEIFSSHLSLSRSPFTGLGAPAPPELGRCGAAWSAAAGAAVVWGGQGAWMWTP